LLFRQDEFSSANLSGEKVAVVHVQGQINNQTARKTVASLRKIKNDCNIKAVVLRVDSPGGSVTASETILQECKDLPQPVVCSMANTCASGGYYIATACDRIFALPTTVTGSIGVFGIKFDLTGLAKKYGISVQHITTGPYSASYHPFQPLNQLVKNNLSQNVDRYYDYFKSIVAESRGLDMKEVELLAQGRVWTGIEAKGNGLVDELGGLERAIAYARRNFTQGDAEVERWPKRESILERFRKASDMVDDDGVFAKLGAMYNVLRAEMDGSTQEPEISEYDAARLLVQTIMDDPKSLETIQLGGVALTIDESSALAHILTENTSKIKMPLLHPSIWS
jgi:protease-4